MNTSCYESARAYARAGWALIPIGPDKQPNFGLLPRDSDGKAVWNALAEQPATEAEVERWFELCPDTNLGVITGWPSGGVVVADFDCRPPRDWYIPVTPRVTTQRGEHVYFFSARPVRSGSLVYNGKRIGELKADGGIAVLPPSLHPAGIRYQWAELLDPWTLGFTLAPLPKWAEAARSPYSSQSLRNENRYTETLSTEYSSEASKEYSLLASPPLRGRELGAWCGNTEFVRAAGSILGIPQQATDRLGTTFRCVLPGHEEMHPSASLFRRADGLIVYHDWHCESGEEWYYLPEVYASQRAGRVVRLRRDNGLACPELAVWQLRLLVVTGLVLPAEVDLPVLPPTAPERQRKVLDGFRFLLQCKWLHTYGEPTPFSWRFASVWCGVSERIAGQAIGELLGMGYIRGAGNPQHGNPSLTLFLPGDDALVSARVTTGTTCRANGSTADIEVPMCESFATDAQGSGAVESGFGLGGEG